MRFEAHSNIIFIDCLYPFFHLPYAGYDAHHQQEILDNGQWVIVKLAVLLHEDRVDDVEGERDYLNVHLGHEGHENWAEASFNVFDQTQNLDVVLLPFDESDAGGTVGCWRVAPNITGDGLDAQRCEPGEGHKQNYGCAFEDECNESAEEAQEDDAVDFPRCHNLSTRWIEQDLRYVGEERDETLQLRARETIA